MTLDQLRAEIRHWGTLPEPELLRRLIELTELSAEARQQIVQAAAALVIRVRGNAGKGLLEPFLAEYGLDTKEGLAKCWG